MPPKASMAELDPSTLLPRLRAIQLELRDALRAHTQTQAVEHLARAVRDAADAKASTEVSAASADARGE